MRHALQAVAATQTRQSHHDAAGTPPVRVLLADERPVVRAELRTLLEHHGDIRVAGEAASGHEAVAQARLLQPDVVLVAGALPGALATTRRIAGDGCSPSGGGAVLMLGAERPAGALAAGAIRVLSGDAGVVELVAAIRAAARASLLPAPRAPRASHRLVAATRRPRRRALHLVVA
jgi:DNA-binding NarL/FixJ family response regulator